MTFADPDGRATSRWEGFVGLAIPATGRLSLRRAAMAPGYAEFTPDDGPRRSWPQPVKWVQTLQGQTVVWCGERRGVADLPENVAAFTVAARLGCADLADRIGLRGNLLLTGMNASGAPADVPEVVVRATVDSGLLPTVAHDVVLEATAFSGLQGAHVEARRRSLAAGPGDRP